MIKQGMYISDRYEIIDKVGSGGMADVYKARCHRLNRFVAIKILKNEYSDDKNFVAKFRAEAQSAAGLSHPNIVNVYDVGEDNGLYYIVMELVEGITLKSFIERKGKLEVKEAIGITIQIAQGMEAAHDNHIIHRDIKPQNIIISREGKVKVTDFGIAKAATSNTITSNAMGSVHYISPEQARGGYSDEKSDIYSLGVTLYEMLTGKVPFVGDNTVSVAILHLQAEATPIRELEPNVPVSIEQIALKCMQKKPERRYLTASELITDLKRSITEPNGDFVKAAPTAITDSPTINLSDEEIRQIKNEAVKTPQVEYHTDNIPIININEEEKVKEKFKDDEEEQEVDPKLEKLMVVGSVIAAIILALIVIVLIGRAFGLFSFGGSDKKDPPSQVEDQVPGEEEDNTEDVKDEEVVEVKVPKVEGETLENASRILGDLNINYTFDTEASDVIEKDYVISQSIAPDTVYDKQDVVKMVVSAGVKPIAIPDVTGRLDEEAMTILKEAGFAKNKHEYDFSDEVEQGRVIRTVPAAKSEAKPDETITIVLSSGKKTVMKRVPDLRNLTQKDAIAKLKEVGLTAGKVTNKYSDEYEKGIVMDQSYTVNTEVEEGTVVDFSVSLGQKEKEYIYVGTVVIDQSPFTDEVTEGTIELELIQDGTSTGVYTSVETEDSFPLSKQIVGNSEAEGKVKMYLDGEPCDGTWVVTFKKVEK